MNKAFWDWWSGGGYKEWNKAIDEPKGTLGALEMVFTRGFQAAQKDVPVMSEEVEDGHIQAKK